MDMEGKIAIVTGGSRGIGRAISEELAKRGANIIVADIQEELAKTTAQEITDSTGRESIGVYVDVVDLESAKSMVDHVKDQYGHVDILINNAGVTRDNLIMRMSEEDWDMVLNVNLKGAFSCSKAVIRPMMKQRFGRIINISSVSGLAGQAGQTNYSASKAGIIGFTKALARESATKGITVNCIAPGYIATDMTKEVPTHVLNAIISNIPAQRLGTPEEIARAVLFLVRPFNNEVQL